MPDGDEKFDLFIDWLGREMASFAGRPEYGNLRHQIDVWETTEGARVTNLALVYTQTGEIEQAVAELEKLRNLPNGPTSGLLRVEPQWQPLRQHPHADRQTDGVQRQGQPIGDVDAERIGE